MANLLPAIPSEIDFHKIGTKRFSSCNPICFSALNSFIYLSTLVWCHSRYVCPRKIYEFNKNEYQDYWKARSEMEVNWLWCGFGVIEVLVSAGGSFRQLEKKLSNSSGEKNWSENNSNKKQSSKVSKEMRKKCWKLKKILGISRLAKRKTFPVGHAAFLEILEATLNE